MKISFVCTVFVHFFLSLMSFKNGVVTISTLTIISVFPFAWSVDYVFSYPMFPRFTITCCFVGHNDRLYSDSVRLFVFRNIDRLAIIANTRRQYVPIQ